MTNKLSMQRAEAKLNEYLSQFDEEDQERLIRYALDHVVPRMKRTPPSASTQAEPVPLQQQAALQAVEIERLKKDAARYRFLRNQNHSMCPRVSPPFEPHISYKPQGLDAAIDAALSTQQEQK